MAIALISLFGATGQAVAQAIPQKNVNVVGPTPPSTGWYVGDTFMQFNEADGACSPNNPRWCAIGMNDYRGVNNPAIGDAFPGIAMTRGETWISGLHPGHLADFPNIGQQFGADPNLEAVPGMLFYNFIAGWRDESKPGGVYISRWYEHNREIGPPWEYLDIIEADLGTKKGKFLDKPAFKVSYLDPNLPGIAIPIPPEPDPADPSKTLHDGFTLTIPAVRLDLCYAVFVGNDNNDGTSITCTYSLDGGVTWTGSKLTESVEINQGISIATRNYGQEALACWLRFKDNNEDDSILCAYSTDGAQTWSKPQLVTKFCPFNQGTGAALHRSNALPVVVSNEEEFAVYFASRNVPTGQNDTCILPAKGNKDPIIQMSNVALEDDFDSLGEDPTASPRERDGKVRMSRNFSRIVMMRTSNPSNPNNWSDAIAVDPQIRDDVAECPATTDPNQACRKNHHQYMPAAFSAGGIETVAWYDTRMDRLNRLHIPITSGFVDDMVVNLISADNNGDGEPDTDADGNPIPPWASAKLLPAGLYDLEPPPIALPDPGNNFPLRRNLDVFAAQIVDGMPLTYTVDPDTYYPGALASQPSPSVRVTRFASRIKRNADGSPVLKEGTSVPEREQMEYNFPNARIFVKGTRPFIGDYNTVFAVNAYLQNGQWVSNQGAIADLAPQVLENTLFPSLQPTFHIGWTTNHKVRGKVYYTGCDRWDETLQMWVSECEGSEYVTPSPPPMPVGALAPLQGEDGSQGSAPLQCTIVGNSNNLKSSNKGPLTRNQKIFTAELKPGINVEVLSAIKDRSVNGGGVPLNTFVLGLQNGSPFPRRLRIELPTSDPYVSFDRTTFVPDDGSPPSSQRLFVDVIVPAGSVNVRTVFDSAGDLPDSIVASVYDASADLDNESEPGDGAPLVARVALNRSSVLPLEPQVAYESCATAEDPTCVLPVDITQEDFFRLLLTRETAATKTLEFQNLEFENLEFQNEVKILDFENSAELLEFENLEFENTLVFLDFQNLEFQNIFVNNSSLLDDSYSLLDFQNLEFQNDNVEMLDFQNLDFQNLEFENRTLYSDLEALEFENTFLEALDFQNLEFQNLDFQNLEFQNLEFQNLDFQNLDFQNLEFQNTAFFSSSVDNEDIRNLTLSDEQVGDTSVEVSWKAESDGNTTTGVDVKPVFSSALVSALEGSGTQVILSVRQLYYTPTVSLTSDTDSFCSVQILATNQVVYSAILSPQEVNTFFSDPDAAVAATPAFQLDPNVESIITLQLVNPPASFDTVEELAAGAGMAIFAQGASSQQCVEDEEIEDRTYDACEIDAPPQDTEAPVITVDGPNPDTVFEDSGTYNDPGATADDAVDGPVAVSVVAGSWDGDTSQPGTYTITYTATDAALNPATATRTVVVLDKTPPVITLNQPTATTAEVGSTYTDPGATAEDNVDGSISVSVDLSLVSTTTHNTQFAVKYTATDAALNTATATRIVTVTDTIPPVIAPNLVDGKLNVTIEAGSGYVDAGATVTDNGTPPALIVTYSDALGNPLTGVDSDVVGAYVVHYNATDAAGLIATERTRTVTVVDTSTPSINSPIPPTFTPELADALINPVNDPDNDPTTIVISWPVSGTDPAGSDLSITCNVDGTTILPVQNPPPSYNAGTETLNAQFAYAFPVGDTTVTCTVTDQGGNSTTSAPFKVTVEDRPVIDENSLPPPPVTVEANSSDLDFAFVGDVGSLWTVTASDGIDPPELLTVACSPNDPSGNLAYGDNTITCTATDSKGNVSDPETFTATVVDTMAPVISVATPDIVQEANAPSGYEWPGIPNAGLWPLIFADDVRDGSVEAICSPSSTSDFPLNTTTVTCVARDAAGNPKDEFGNPLSPGDADFPETAKATFTVTIQDTIAPVFGAAGTSPLPGNISLEQQDASGYKPTTPLWSDPVANAALDTVDGLVAATCSGAGSSGPLGPTDTFPAGITEVSCAATDASNNKSSVPAAFTVTVGDNTSPLVTIDLGTSYTAEATGPDGASINFVASAQDLGVPLATSCTVGGTAVTSGHTFPLGSSVLTCVALDAAGNQGSSTTAISVVDTTAPEVSAEPLTLYTTSTSATVSEADLLPSITASDLVDGEQVTVSCDIADTTVYPINEPTDEPNYYAITCTASDSRGNAADAVLQLTIAFQYAFGYELPKGKLKAGSVLPVDFWYEQGGARIDASGIQPRASWFGPINTQGCPAATGSSPGTGEDAGSSRFRWETLGDFWQFNWQTPSEIGLYQFTISPPGTSESSIPVCLK